VTCGELPMAILPENLDVDTCLVDYRFEDFKFQMQDVRAARCQLQQLWCSALRWT
jgi:hypothetical protein